jgi:hypothetical protein
MIFLLRLVSITIYRIYNVGLHEAVVSKIIIILYYLHTELGGEVEVGCWQRSNVEGAMHTTLLGTNFNLIQVSQYHR